MKNPIKNEQDRATTTAELIGGGYFVGNLGYRSSDKTHIRT